MVPHEDRERENQETLLGDLFADPGREFPRLRRGLLQANGKPYRATLGQFPLPLFQRDLVYIVFLDASFLVARIVTPNAILESQQVRKGFREFRSKGNLNAAANFVDVLPGSEANRKFDSWRE